MARDAEDLLSRDRALLVAFKEGKAQALTKAFDFYLPEVAGLLRRGIFLRASGLRVPPVKDAAEQDDLLQDIFLRAFAPAARAAYDGRAPYRPYLLTIARNVVIDWARKSKREVPLSALETGDGQGVDLDALIEGQPLVLPDESLERQQTS
jgi:DNA-directed RNA polymerase specialized sigma24 family protein